MRDHRLQDVVLRLSTLKGLAEHFPQTPFLRIPLQSRERQAAALELDLNYSPVANIAKRHPNMEAKGTDLVVNGKLLNKVEYFDDGICFGVYPVRLNFSLEKGVFQRLLLEWAESKRSDDVTSLSHRRTSPMDHLNSLEAFRLAKTGLPYEKIRTSAAEALKKVPGNAILQYTSSVSLNNAKNKALEHMREVFMSERPPLEDRRYKGRASTREAKPKE